MLNIIWYNVAPQMTRSGKIKGFSSILVSLMSKKHQFQSVTGITFEVCVLFTGRTDHKDKFPVTLCMQVLKCPFPLYGRDVEIKLDLLKRLWQEEALLHIIMVDRHGVNITDPREAKLHPAVLLQCLTGSRDGGVYSYEDNTIILKLSHISLQTLLMKSYARSTSIAW